MVKTKLFTPNAGILEYGKIVTERDKFKQVTGEAFKQLGLLKFNYSSIRQQDVELIGGDAPEQTLKVRTYFRPDVPTSLKVKIDKQLYDIVKIDPAFDRKSMFWYLTAKGEFDEKR